MEMILLDWTRMGKTFCIAGLVADGDGWRTVRPMPAVATRVGDTTRLRSVLAALVGPRPANSPTEPPRNVGWFARQLEMLERWDIVELVDPQSADVARPHTEDVWVRVLRPTGRSVPQAQRAATLQQMAAACVSPRFGAPLLTTHTSAYLKPATGDRSLTTLIVPSSEIRFEASDREGAAETDVRAQLNLPGLGTKLLPVKDHHLLCHGERSATDPAGLAHALRDAVAIMGPVVAVRLGLSRGYDSGRGEERCWLMADGFFSAEDVSI